MRVALQISGDFRVLHHSFEKLMKNICSVPEVQVDIFIHTWKRDTTSHGTFPVKERGNWNMSMFVHSHMDGLNIYKVLVSLNKYPINKINTIDMKNDDIILRVPMKNITNINNLRNHGC